MKHAGIAAAFGLTALLVTAGAVAQEGTEEEPTLGAEGEAQAAEIVGEYDDWVVRCQPAPESEFGAGELCEMYQQVSEQESQQTVLETVIGYPEGAEAPIALFNLPLGMRLPPGVELQVDDNEAIQFPVQLCLQSGCRADIQIEEDLLAQMRAGSEAVLTIADPQGRGVELPLSLMGFSDALDDVESRR